MSRYDVNETTSLLHPDLASVVVDEESLARVQCVTGIPQDSSCGENGTIEQKPNAHPHFINLTAAEFWGVFTGILFSWLLANFDSTLMASIHPAVTSHFHAANSASWLSTVFLLTSTAFQPVFGRISDVFGRRPVYLFAVATFLITTAWCATAQSIGSFIAARAFCGLGAGGVTSVGMIISSDIVR
ncbi:hypothetical protein FQN49_003599, partial [Arthroderma sp. PD_2]